MIRRLCLGNERFWMSAGQCRCDARLSQSDVLPSARERIVKAGDPNAPPRAALGRSVWSGLATRHAWS